MMNPGDELTEEQLAIQAAALHAIDRYIDMVSPDSEDSDLQVIGSGGMGLTRSLLFVACRVPPAHIEEALELMQKVHRDFEALGDKESVH